MATINQVESKYKTILRDFSEEEIKHTLHNFSKKKIGHSPFISVNGHMNIGWDKYNEVEKSHTNLLFNLPKVKESFSVGLVYDFEELQKKYLEEVLIASTFYIKVITISHLLLEQVNFTLSTFLDMYNNTNDIPYSTLETVLNQCEGVVNGLYVYIEGILEDDGGYFKEDDDYRVLRKLIDDANDRFFTLRRTMKEVIENGHH